MSDRPYNLFISYAHKSEAVKDRLLGHLKLLKRNGLIATWDDRAIPAGSGWREEVETAMAAADAAIFLLDEYFLASDFCVEVELAWFRHKREARVLILFVLTDHCMWEEVEYIQRTQLLPRDARPIIDFDPPSLAYTAVAREIKTALLEHRERQGLPARSAAPAQISEAVTGEAPLLGLAALLARLPGQTDHLFGREAELEQLTGWQAHKRVFLWVAPGGIGKSALTRWWLERQDWPAGTRFLGHSFYSQGSHNQATSARGFLTSALDTLGVAHGADAADDELGRLLAEQAALAPTVLLLDGLEPLQQASADAKLNGTVRDRGLAALLEGLGRNPGKALCLASSRLPIPDVGIRDAHWYRERELEALPKAGALELLHRRGLQGEEAALAQVTERCGYHPLALVLAAEFCHNFLNDSAVAFLERDWPLEVGESHSDTVMAWLDRELADEQQALDRELLRCIGLFDRPAPWGALMALKEHEPPIPGVTEQLHQADEAALLEALARLRQWGLVQADLTRPLPDLDAHPLVRERFGTELERQEPKAYKIAHWVLFDRFRRQPQQEQPDTLEALEPLYRAVGHGCRAGAYRTACENIYRDRIQRGEQRYEQFQLGAWSSDLAALAGFFPEGWNRPPVTGKGDEALNESDRSWLLAEVAFCLMSLGRLEEALGPRRMDVKWCKDKGDWKNFCRSSEGLVGLLTPLGRWGEAEKVAREALEAAGRIQDREERWQRTVTANAFLGHILHGQGRLADALECFVRAEAAQAEARPHEPKLYGLRGFDYAQVLLEQACRQVTRREVLERGRYSLEIVKGLKHLLSQALDHCTVGQALAALGQTDGEDGVVAAPDRAVSTMRRAGSVLDYPVMHLARAQLRRSRGDLAGAWQDQEAALTIARRGNMRTYLAECALLAGNLHLDAVDVPEATGEHAEAARLIREDGYGRREAELHLLQARLLYHEADLAGARAALQAAESRIREIGQWGLWDRLCQVGQEIGVALPKECPPEAGD